MGKKLIDTKDILDYVNMYIDKSNNLNEINIVNIDKK